MEEKDRDPENLDPEERRQVLLEALNRGENLEGRLFPEIDLSDQQLRGVRAEGVELPASDLANACLDDAYLKGADLCGARLIGASLCRADLRQATLSDVDAMGAAFDEADLREANLHAAHLNKASLRGADLRGVDLESVDLEEADLTEAKLFKAYLGGADLSSTRLDGASFDGVLYNEDTRWPDGFTPPPSARCLRSGEMLDGADLCGFDLSASVLAGASLRRADLRYGTWNQTDFQGADLREADLRESGFHDASFRGAHLDGANLENARLGQADLRGACLRGADLLSAANLTLVRLDIETYVRSGWTPETLRDLVRRGVHIDDLSAFPLDAQRAVLGMMEGLTLYFHTPIQPLDRMLIEATVASLRLARPESDCQVVEFQAMEGAALVRLAASDLDDLIDIADALHQRVWERTPRRGEDAIAALQVVQHLGALVQPRMLDALSYLVDRGDRFELWVRDGENLRCHRTWDIPADRMQALGRLLTILFVDPDRLRHFLQFGPQTEELSSDLPDRASMQDLAWQVVQGLERRGLVDQALFTRLIFAFQRREQEILAVARLWGLRGDTSAADRHEG